MLHSAKRLARLSDMYKYQGMLYWICSLHTSITTEEKLPGPTFP